LQRRNEYIQQQPHHPSVDSALDVIRKGISVQEKRVGELVTQLEHLDRRETLELKAPIDGVISQILHHQTEVVLAGEPIVTIADGEITDIIAFASNGLMDKVREGMVVELIKSSEPAKIQIESSEVTYVGPVVEQMPSQLWLNPNVPQWGRPFLIKAPAVMKLIAGERVGIRTQ
jgi:multidrug resistance efflux pump